MQKGRTLDSYAQYSVIADAVNLDSGH